jgi:hypothetical protein
MKEPPVASETNEKPFKPNLASYESDTEDEGFKYWPED